MKLRRILLFMLIALGSSTFSMMQPDPEPITANGSVFGAFRTAYPDTGTTAASCQVCHMNASGGNGWNAYGWKIRQGIEEDGLAIAAAIAAAEALDSDGSGVSNLDEINAGRLPGWTVGAVNTIFFKDGTTMANQLPPNPGVALDIAVAITNPITSPLTSDDGITISLHPIADDLINPLVGTSTASLPDHLFVVDQPGQVYQIDLATGAKSTFLDVSSQLITLGGIFGDFDERGLLSMAFHPDYATNGLVYTYQSEAVQGAPTFTTTVPISETANHQSVVAEWTVTDPANSASVVDMTTKRVVMRIDEPQFNHNGGQLAFGPDNMLYIAVGDGGGADDADGQPFVGAPISGHSATGNGRNAANPLGTILRIDPNDTSSANGQYGIPADNPFVGDEDRLDEIYAYGFRNVFRFSFSAKNGDLYAGDVGQNDIEEVDIVTPGGNYGWNYKEGSVFFDTNGVDDGFVTADPGGLPTDLIDPIAEYDHDEGLSVIGGFVYSGTQVPELDGVYVFGDWSLDFAKPPGRLFHLDAQNAIQEFQISNLRNLGIFLNGFGEDANGELYVLGNSTGAPVADADGNKTGVVLKIVRPGPYAEGSTASGDFSGDRTKPEQFALSAGDNLISASSSQGDAEYYAVSIPAGMELDSIVLTSYESSTDRSFIGIQSGPIFTEPSTDTVRANLLGYTLFGSDPISVTTNILDDMGAVDDAIGFSGPLPSGTYTIWSQETSPDESRYSLNFVVKGATKTYVPTVINQ